MPVLIVHGTDDRFVLAHSRRRFTTPRACRSKLLLVENGSHNNSMWMGNGAYQRALVELFGLSGAPEGDAHVTGYAPAR